VQAEKDLTGFL